MKQRIMFVAPTPKLPRPERWHSLDKRDADAMVDWVKERLKVRLAKSLNRRFTDLMRSDQVEIDPETHLAEQVIFTDEEAQEAAMSGNLEPLLQKHPWLRRFHIRPRRGHGERTHTPNWRAEAAVRDVYFIRRLWRCAYNGRWKRGEYSNPPTAEQIAAKFWNVDVRSVKSRVRH